MHRGGGGSLPLARTVPFAVTTDEILDEKEMAKLGMGALLAPVFSLTPILQYMGWFLGSLCHEIGHSVVAWVFGMPAFPAIRPREISSSCTSVGSAGRRARAARR